MTTFCHIHKKNMLFQNPVCGGRGGKLFFFCIAANCALFTPAVGAATYFLKFFY